MDTKKRILIAIGFIALCILLGYVMYRVFFAPSTPEIPPGTETPSTSTTPGSFPESGAGTGSTTRPPSSTDLPTSPTRPDTQTGQSAPRVEQVVNDSINSVKKGSTGFNYYNVQDGKFYTLGPDGQPVPLDDKVFFNVQNVTWGNGRNEGILEYPDGSNIYYNFETKRQVSLPKHWEDFSFSPESDKIAAKSISVSAQGNWLLSASSDGRQVKLVEPLGENAQYVDVDWSPNKQIIALARTGDPLGADQEQVLFVGENQQNFKSITVEGRGLVSEWSPNGKKLLYSVYSQRSDFKPELWIVNGEASTIGSERRLLNVNTWADKCTFSDERFVFCGVPTTLEKGAGFVPALANNTPDRIFKVDTKTGIKTEIPVDSEHVIESMFLGDDGKTLYFTDKNQTGLFRVNY